MEMHSDSAAACLEGRTNFVSTFAVQRVSPQEEERNDCPNGRRKREDEPQAKNGLGRLMPTERSIKTGQFQRDESAEERGGITHFLNPGKNRTKHSFAP